MRIGIADTTFARVDMARVATEELGDIETVRYTVPGMKDLAVACLKLFEEHDCDLCIALGWVGGEDIDETCAHEANLALQQAELMARKHILKVFVHEREGGDIKEIAAHRVTEHARNARLLLKGKDALREHAGKGKRQGHDDAGAL